MLKKKASTEMVNLYQEKTYLIYSIHKLAIIIQLNNNNFTIYKINLALAVF